MATAGAVVAGLTALAAYLYGPATHGALTKFGAFRELTSTPLANPEDLIIIKDTIHCEDLHYYPATNTIFTACEDASATRFKWFPPLAFFEDPKLGWDARGSIHTIDPETKISQRLAFENFDGPFITHGIDVIPDPESSEAVYIVAINHVPNEKVFPRDGSSPETTPETAPKGASRLEVFHHVLGSPTVQHKHTIAHPLIRTPNDVYAVSPTEVYVTNDHRYYEGIWRTVEDMWPGAHWSDVVHATLGPDGTVDAGVALDKKRNPNGFGHGRTADELLVASAVGGYVEIGRRSEDGRTIVLEDVIDLESTVDNPSWFVDEYAGGEGGDASGFVLGGLTRGIDLSKTGADPNGREGVIVWYVKPGKEGGEKWNKTLLWQDDGSNIRNAATAVLVGIDPKKEGGKKKGWLFVSGFSSENAVAVKVDL